MQPDLLLAENKRLQRCISDVVSIMALPAMWVGREAAEIANSLLDSILGMLDLDFACLYLNGTSDYPALEVTRLSRWARSMTPPGQFAALLAPWNSGGGQVSARRLAVGGSDLAVLSVRLGLLGEIGLLVVGSRRAHFPHQTEELLLNVAANQATIGLQAAWQLSEQKRLTRVLDQRVAQRTAELTTSNTKLLEEVSERQRAEETLRSSEWNLRHLTETIPQMLWSARPDGAIDYCNARLLDFTGFTATGIMGDGWKGLVHPDDRDQAARAWSASVATGMAYHVEARLAHAADHSWRWCLTTGLPLRDDDGKILKWHGVCVDMHDWKRAQDELRETQAELAHITRVMTMGQLAASIAHELNQPLAGIMTNAGTGLRMLTAEPPNVDGARETARRTIRDAKRASEVIARLRALFARRPPALESVDLNAAAQEVAALSLRELERGRVVLRVNLAENLPLIVGDRVQLQQVMLNLLRNGAESMAEVADRAKELVLSTELEETGHVRFGVKDAGAGFDADLMEKLFAPFYTTKKGGMGIGLSVSRTIIENHQGRLWAEPNDGPGSTFCFAVPSGPIAESAAVPRHGLPRRTDAAGNA